MITSIFVYKKSGLCLFHKNFLDPHEEPHALTGFFSAINVFSSCLFKEKVQTLATDNVKITFQYYKDNIFAVISDKGDDVENKMDDLILYFLSEYTKEKDNEFKTGGRIPDFHYLDSYLESFNELPMFQRC